MRVWALCSWYDEKPDHLREMVESVAPLVDGVVAVDGAYALYPDAQPESPPEQERAIREASVRYGLECHVLNTGTPWIGGEVRKRAAMFHYALRKATAWEDWFLIMDGDMLLDPSVNADHADQARGTLAETDHDVAEVTFAELAYGSTTHTVHTQGFRSLFRAIPGLTVEHTHWLYNIPDASRPAGRRFMWHGITTHGSEGQWLHAPEPAADVRSHVRLLHRPHVREADRVRARAGYYEARERAVAERVPTTWD